MVEKAVDRIALKGVVCVGILGAGFLSDLHDL
jgi:hypothetical protein